MFQVVPSCSKQICHSRSAPGTWISERNCSHFFRSMAACALRVAASSCGRFRYKKQAAPSSKNYTYIYIIFTRSSQEFHRFTSTPCSTVCNFGENICSMAKLASVGAGCDDNCVSSASQDAAAATVPSSLHHSSITAHVNFANKTGAVRKQSLLSM